MKTYDDALNESMRQWSIKIATLEAELLRVMIVEPRLRPVLAPFVRMLGRPTPATRLGRFVERVRIHYAMLRLTRDFPRGRIVR